MKFRTSTALALLFLLIMSGAQAQGPITPVVPVPTPAPLQTAIPPADDARAATCSAPTLPGFAPHSVRPGDTAASLLAGSDSLTPAQFAALNCLDDPNALPVGAVVWLPAAAESPAVGDPNARAAIADFTADAQTVNNQLGVELAWEAQGMAAFLYPCPPDPDAACVRPVGSPSLPLAHALHYPHFQTAGAYRFRLEVIGAEESIATRDLQITVECAQPWLGGIGASPRCPEAPAQSVTAVWQAFEGGALIWFSDTQEIYVLTADGRVSVYLDQFVEGQGDPAAVSPEGLLTPVRGFGQVWQGLGGAEGPLGWAVAPEQAYEAARQPAGRTSFTTYLQAPEGEVYALTLVPGLERGYWVRLDAQSNRR